MVSIAIFLGVGKQNFWVYDIENEIAVGVCYCCS